MAKPRSNRLTQLGELQLQVMEVLWGLDEGTVYDVQARFPPRRRPKYSTLLTVLRTLSQKGLATYRTQERTYIFRAKVPREELQRNVLGDVLGQVFSGSPKALVTALLDVETMTPEALAELKELIAAREGEAPDEQ